MKNKLIPMEDFVLEQVQKKVSVVSHMICIENYANFIKQDLNVSQFVPAKLVNGVWVVLEEPKCECLTEFDREGCSEKCYEYRYAENCVLFDGIWKVKNNNSLYTRLKKSEESIIFFTEPKSISFYDIFSEASDVHAIRDLIQYNLTVTPTGQKQSGLI